MRELYPPWIYPRWDQPDDFDDLADYKLACRIAEIAHDQELLPARLKEMGL